MDNKPIIAALSQTLADNYALLAKTHNYHWNVTGAQFKYLHEMFEEQYNDLFAAIDEIAERVRILGEKVPASLSLFANRTKIKAGNENLTAVEMVKDLAESNETVIEGLRLLQETAESANDQVSVDLAISRLEVHEKAVWFLKSSI